jgi:hypothetical protein
MQNLYENWSRARSQRLQGDCFQDLVVVAAEGGTQKLMKLFTGRRLMAVVIMEQKTEMNFLLQNSISEKL